MNTESLKDRNVLINIGTACIVVLFLVGVTFKTTSYYKDNEHKNELQDKKDELQDERISNLSNYTKEMYSDLGSIKENQISLVLNVKKILEKLDDSEIEFPKELKKNSPNY